MREELKEGVWREPIQAMLVMDSKALQCDEEAGRGVQKRLCDVDLSDEKKCQGCGGEEGTVKHRYVHL